MFDIAFFMYLVALGMTISRINDSASSVFFGFNSSTAVNLEYLDYIRFAR